MANSLLLLKERRDFLTLSNAQSLQQSLKDLNQAMKSCFNSGFGFPKFKKRGIYDAFRVPQYFLVNASSIIIPKIGTLRIGKHHPLNGTPKHLTISRKGKKWYVSVCLEFEPTPLPKTGSQIGLDVGAARLATTSNSRFKKPFTALNLEHRIKLTQRQLSKKKKGGQNHEKTKSTLNTLYQRLRNKRQDYLQKYSTYLIKSHDLIAVEDLKILNMTRSAKGTKDNPGKNVKQKSGLNQSILRQSWGELFRQLEYKADWYDKEFLKVNPQRTSTTCSSCGYFNKRNRKSQALFICGKCHKKINADQNAARVILQRGLEVLNQAA
jgi:putative transposase